MNDEASISGKDQKDEKEWVKDSKVEHGLARKIKIKEVVDTIGMEEGDTIIE